MNSVFDGKRLENGITYASKFEVSVHIAIPVVRIV